MVHVRPMVGCLSAKRAHINMIIPALLLVQAAANPPILYDWRPPLTRGWANRSRSVPRVRGVMNSGTNDGRSLVEQLGGVKVV